MLVSQAREAIPEVLLALIDRHVAARCLCALNKAVESLLGILACLLGLSGKLRCRELSLLGEIAFCELCCNDALVWGLPQNYKVKT